MASAATQIQIAPHENDMVVEMRGFAQRMIRSLSTTGSSAASSDVLAFQQAWNRNLPIIKSLLSKLGQPTSAAKVLAEDGRYGTNTAAALCGIVCGPGLSSKPPTKASGMPVWTQQNNDYINALTPPAPLPAQSVLDDPPPIPQSGGDALDAQTAIDSGGSTIRNLVPVPLPSGATPSSAPVVISTTTSYPPGTNPPVAEIIEQTDFSAEPLTIVATPRRNRTPWIAAGLGIAGLGGVLYWWTHRKKLR